MTATNHNITNIATKIMELERALINNTEPLQKMSEILYELLYGVLYKKIDDTINSVLQL